MYLKEEAILTSGNTKETTPLSQLRVDSRGRGEQKGNPLGTAFKEALTLRVVQGRGGP